MSVNVLIKEVKNLNISNDTDDVTVTSHEVENVEGVAENPEDLSGGENVLSKSEIADIVKKQLEDSNAQFVDMAADDIVGMFDEFIDKGVDISAFDYKIYSRDFYAERFPGFEPRFYECLERASAEKFVDQSDKKDWRNYTYEVGEYTVTFGGEDESRDEGEVYSDAVSDIKD